MWKELKDSLEKADIKALSRIISLVENKSEGWREFLGSLQIFNDSTIIGVTGPPGAGKSTLTDKLVKHYVLQGKRTAVLCVDPSSPFKMGAVLGDRIRMNEWHDNPLVYIRSLATRGSLGGLHPSIMEITDILKAAKFDVVIIETVGVGQSEVEIAGLADVTLVVLVPESGDEIQTMKSGLMEIADLFVVNKSDRPGSDLFLKNLRLMLSHGSEDMNHVQAVKTVATRDEGITELAALIDKQKAFQPEEKKLMLLAEKAYYLIREERMKDVSKESLLAEIRKKPGNLNIYSWIREYLPS